MSGLSQALKVHVALNVRDVNKSVEFYTKVFGVAPMKVRPGYAKFDVEFPQVNLSLNQGVPDSSGALSHLGIQVPSSQDVLAVRDQWQSAGLEPRDEMQTNCCYALQDKAWVSDPDGNQWEVFVVLQDNLPDTNSCCSPLSSLVTL